MTRDTQCQGGCGKVRSILHADDPADWLCYECRRAAMARVQSANRGQHPQVVPDRQA